MRSFRRLVVGLVLAGLWATTAGPSLAADNGTVDATVTVATPCIIVTPGSVDFGTLPFTTTAVQGFGVQGIEISNCGTSTEQLFGRGTNATANGQTIWTLVDDHDPCFVGANEFNLQARSTGGPNQFLGTTDLLLETVSAGSPADTNQLALIMPCVGSDGIGETVSFQAVFTATF